jgi:hypothetical protein
MMRRHACSVDASKIFARKKCRMIFFKDVILKAVPVRLYGVVHSPLMSSQLNATEVYKSLIYQAPSSFLVETSEGSLELSQFVWDSRYVASNAENFCREECKHTESAAIAACTSLGLPFSAINAIDVDPGKTRRALARSALFHPWESLKLISRYHGDAPEMRSLEEVAVWRSEFAACCPHAFEILFTEREEWMGRKILESVKSGSNIAVLVGLSHVDGLFDVLTCKALQ